LAQISGCHAFAAYVGPNKDGELVCRYFASGALDTISLPIEANAFFTQQLIDKFQQGPASSFQVHTVQYSFSASQHQGSFEKRLPTLSDIATAMTVRFPGRAFIWYVKASCRGTVQTHHHAASQLQGIFQSSEWAQHVNTLLAKAPAALSQFRPDRDGSSSAATASQDQHQSRRRQPKQPATSVPGAARPSKTRRKAQLQSSIEQPGTLNWYRSMLSQSSRLLDSRLLGCPRL